jgi:Fe2+ transport system protein FeoA
MATSLKQELLDLTPKGFEHFLADMYEERGWTTHLTKESGDDGVDVIAIRDDYYPQKRVIQAKHGQDEPRLSRRTVQQYAYLHHKDDVDEVILATTGSFTQAARDSARTANIKLLDLETLIELIRDTAPADAIEEFDVEPPAEHIENPAPITTVSPGVKGEIEAYANSNDVYPRLLATLGGDTMSLRARLAILLQQFRGDDRLHVLLVHTQPEAVADVIETVRALTGTPVLDCTRTDQVALIGRYTPRGTVSPGVFRAADDGLVTLKRLGELDAYPPLIEPLADGSISVANEDYQASFDVDASVLATTRWRYGVPDQYEPMGEQIPLPSRCITLFDGFAATEFSVTDLTLVRGQLQSTETVTSIPMRIVRQHRFLASQLDPSLTTDATELLLEVTDAAVEANDNPPPRPLKEHLESWGRAAARLRLSESVTRNDLEIVCVVCRDNFHPAPVREVLQAPQGETRDEAPLDVTAIETGRTVDERGRIKKVIAVISEIDAQNDTGAPRGEVLNRLKAMGIARDKAEHEIEKLRQSGDLYEPQTDHLRKV